METQDYTSLFPTMEQRQEKILDIVEILEEQANEFARDMQQMQVKLIRLFEMQNRRVAALGEKAAQS